MMLYLRNLDSIFQQDYQNYHLVYVDDKSPDRTGYYVQKYMEQNNIPKQKYTLIQNQQRKGGQQNIYNGATNHCNQGQVIVNIDGDDSLIGRQVFSLLNALYQKYKPAMTYGQCLNLSPGKIEYCTSQQIPLQTLDENGSYRKRIKFFPTGHVKTLYTDLYRKVKKQDLQFKNGSFYSYATDQAYMIPALQMVKQRSLFVKQLLYEYRTSTGYNQDFEGQLKVLIDMRQQKKPYSKLTDLSFADNPKIKHYDQKKN